MNTIEKATRRLEQLQRAGIARPVVEVGAAESPAVLDGHREPSSKVAPLHPAVSPSSDLSAPSVTIDLARLLVGGYVTPNAARSRRGEEFRIIKRPLLNNARGRHVAAPVLNANRIMVTSSLPGEGKTFVSVNLAMSLAMELDTTALLVDTDTTRPAVLERLGLPPSRGLLDLLSEPMLDLESVLLKTNVDGLWVLPAGTMQERATELLASESMTALVDKLASRFPNRILIFDTPPLLVSSESRVLAAHMGQVILVIEADTTPQRTVVEALATIENCPVVMTLLNKAPVSEAGSYYGSYYGSRS